MTGTPPPSRPPAYETRDISFGAIAGWIIVLLILVAVSQFVAFGVHRHFIRARAQEVTDLSPLAQMRRLPPEPRLQVSPSVDLLRMREKEGAVLNSYGWVDSQAGVVRIPIDRAMDLIAQRGLPAQAPAARRGSR